MSLWAAWLLFLSFLLYSVFLKTPWSSLNVLSDVCLIDWLFVCCTVINWKKHWDISLSGCLQIFRTTRISQWQTNCYSDITACRTFLGFSVENGKPFLSRHRAGGGAGLGAGLGWGLGFSPPTFQKYIHRHFEKLLLINLLFVLVLNENIKITDTRLSRV